MYACLCNLKWLMRVQLSTGMSKRSALYIFQDILSVGTIDLGTGGATKRDEELEGFKEVFLRKKLQYNFPKMRGHIGPILAPEAILFESPCRAHSET